MDHLPSFDQLPIDSAKPPGSTWGLWGDDDELGTINLLTPGRVRAAAGFARDGAVFSLNWNLELPEPPFFGRASLRHEITAVSDTVNDDHYDSFYPQQSSQWDSLSHVGHPDYGFYNGRSAIDFTGQPGTKNGIENMARRGIVGRGVLVDIERYYSTIGRPYEPWTRVEITVEDLVGAAESQGTELWPGDILLIRTGWIGWYESTDPATRAALAVDSAAKLQLPGLAPGQDMVRYLWDSHVAAAATDTPAFEAGPQEVVVGKYLHYDLLALLGMPIGELFALDELADDCARDGRYEFLFVSAPLNKLGGVGSPPNAIAIK